MASAHGIGGSSSSPARMSLDVGEVIDSVPNEATNIDVRVEKGQADSAMGPLPEAAAAPPRNSGVEGYSLPNEGKPINIVFMFVHGASFSSKLFDSNLREFLSSLSDVNHDWYWELDLNFHVEMIDWKSCLAPYQFKSISRCMPVESIYDTDDEDDPPTPDDPLNSRFDGDDNTPSRPPPDDLAPPHALLAADSVATDNAPIQRTARSDSVFGGWSRYFKWNSMENPSSRPRSQKADSPQSDGRHSFRTEPEPTSGRRPSQSETLGDKILGTAEVAGSNGGAAQVPKLMRSRSSGKSRKGCLVSEIREEPDNVREFRELQKKHGLRVYFSNTVVDVMFYLTARYGSYMTTQVGRMLNQRVRDLRASPCGRFRDSEIVLVGHSLGSIILYELLSGRPLRAKLYDDVDEEDTSLFPDQPLPAKEEGCGTTIDFDVKHLFLWGSPLSSFLVLKNDKSLVPDGALTQQRGKGLRMYNIFHRSDPIATRIEPIFYKDREYIPPAVKIPSYHQGDVLRRGIELVAKNSVRAAATMFVNKLFSNGQGMPEGTEEWCARLLGIRRYDLPDPLDKKQRFGVLTLLPESSTPRPASQRNTESIGEDITDMLDKTGSWGRRSSQSMEGRDKCAGLRLDDDDFEDLMTQKVPLSHHRPWSVRQLALNCTRKLRKKASIRILEKLELIQADRRRGLCVKLFAAIDTEFDSLLNSICSVGINKVESIRFEEEPWIEERRLSDLLSCWQAAALHRELLLTGNQLRREVAKSLNCENSEVEREGPSYYPLRLDFSLTGGIQEMLIAPLGLLQSHLKYWSDRDTCLFMLKMITGFSPQIPRTRRDLIVNEARKTKERVFRLIQKMIK